MKRQFLINNTDINIFTVKALSDSQVNRLFDIVLNSGKGATLTNEERFILNLLVSDTSTSMYIRRREHMFSRILLFYLLQEHMLSWILLYFLFFVHALFTLLLAI